MFQQMIQKMEKFAENDQIFQLQHVKCYLLHYFKTFRSLNDIQIFKTCSNMLRYNCTEPESGLFS